MGVFKCRVLKFSLIGLILLSVVLCIYSIHNYKGSSVSMQNVPGMYSRFGGRGASGPGPGSGTGGQFQGPDQSQPGAPGGFQGQPGGPSNFQMPGGKENSGSVYGPMLMIYSVMFLGLSIAAYYFIAVKRTSINPGSRKIIIITIFALGLTVRIFSSLLMEGHPFDISLFKSWASSAANNLTDFYSGRGSSDYPPLYIYVLYLVGKASGISALSSYFTLLVKLPSIVADLVSGFIIYRIANKCFSWEISTLLSAFYIFNPAVLINSTFWGQVDSFFTLIVILAVYLLSEKKLILSSALFAAAVLMKPQGIIFLPVLFFELVRRKSIEGFLKAGASFLCTAVILIFPFSMGKNPIWVINLYSNALKEYPYASVNGFNFFNLIGANYVKDSSTLFIFSYHTWGMISILLITLFTWFVYIKGKKSIFAPLAALILISGVFTFSSGMHERYLFPAAALSLVSFIYIKDKRLLLLALGFSGTVYLNTHLVLFGILKGLNNIPFSFSTYMVSLINVGLLVYLVKIAIDIVLKNKINALT